MSPTSDFPFTNVRLFLFERWHSVRKETRRRTSTRLEVSRLEDRALLSATAAFTSTHGSLAAATGVAESRSLKSHAPRIVQSPTPTLTPIERLGYYNPQTKSFEQLVDVPNYQSLLHAKDVYVLVHGWAPGYISWVKNYEDKYHQVLEWWQTIPQNYKGGPGTTDVNILTRRNVIRARALRTMLTGFVVKDGNSWRFQPAIFWPACRWPRPF